MNSFNNLKIEGFKSLKDISLITSNKIIVNKLEVIGCNLKVVKLDDYHLEITGIIEDVKVR